MKKHALALIFTILLAVPAAARPVNDFTVEDGQASYQFALEDTEMKLFFFSYQNQTWSDQRSKVFTYKPTGPAPVDSPVAREEIAKAVKWLFTNEMARVDSTHPAELPFGISCFPVITIADGKDLEGLGIRFTVESGAIRKVEVASCMTCRMMPDLIKDYEAKKPKAKK
jgi:hypothetical protein